MHYFNVFKKNHFCHKWKLTDHNHRHDDHDGRPPHIVDRIQQNGHVHDCLTPE